MKQKLTNLQKEAILLIRQHTLLFFSGANKYEAGGKFVHSTTVASLRNKGILEKPEFSSVHSLTELGKQIDL